MSVNPQVNERIILAMSKEAIQAQIEAMPDGPKKELADYMNKVYNGEADVGWSIVGSNYRYDLLEAPTWEPVANSQHQASNADAITENKRNRLLALRDTAGGWFYLKDGEIHFVTLKEWEQIKQGEIRP